MVENIVFQTEPKVPANIMLVPAVDITNRLGAGESVAGVGSIATTVFDPLGADVTSTLLVTSSVTFASNKIQCRIQAGDHNKDYTLRYRVTIAPNSRTEDFVVKIPVRTRPH